MSGAIQFARNGPLIIRGECKEGLGMRTVLLVLLILMLLGAFPVWPHSANWGYYPSGGIGLLLIVVLVLAFSQRR